MGQQLFEKNYKSLIDNNGTLELKELEYEKIADYDECMRVTIDGKQWFLQSNVDRSHAINVWCEQFKNISYLTSFVIFGFGDRRYVRELYARYPDNSIIIYEPTEEILVRQMYIEDMSDILGNPHIKIAIGKNRRNLLEIWFKMFISYGGMETSQFAIIPNYNKMFEAEYEEYIEQIKQMIDWEIMNRNTKIVREDCRADGFLYNLDRFWKESGIAELRKTFDALDKEERAAVLIAAGPSLDKNIHLLSEYKGKVFIVCVDAALRVALKHKIRPDIIVTQDPKFKDTTMFDNEYAEQLPVIVSMTSDYHMVQKSKGRKFYISEGVEYVDYIVDGTKGELYGLHTGGSVANTAFSFIFQVAGFKNIILVGQDLGYPGNKKHANDVFYDEEMISEENHSGYFYVDSIDGGKVLTEENMNIYRLWYENVLVDYPELNVIDATEGGALIKGTKIQTLEEALHGYDNVESYDYEKLINNSDFLFTDKEKELVQDRIEKSYNSLDEMVEKLKKQEQVYDKLDGLNRKRKYGTNAFEKCIHEVEEFHKWANSNKDMNLISLYTNRDEYAILDEMQKDVTNTYGEISLVIKSGKKLLNAYIDGANKLKKEWRKMREYERGIE